MFRLFQQSRTLLQNTRHSLSTKTTGDNILHQNFRQLKTVESFVSAQSLLHNIAVENQSYLCRQTNDHGSIPFDVLLEAEPVENAKDRYQSLVKDLLKLTMTHNIASPLSVPCKGSTIFTLKDSPLQIHLKIARAILNDTRAFIKKSSTHPECNFYSHEERRVVCEKVALLKNKTEGLYPIKANLYQKRVAEIAIEAQVGNCEELSLVALNFLQKRVPECIGEAYHIQNGDHCILVIGKHPEEHRYQWEIWSKDVVICDPWLGIVYPATEIPEKLVDAIGYGSNNVSRCNVIKTFNPKFHKLIPLAETVEKNSKTVRKDQLVARIPDLIKKFDTLFHSMNHTNKQNYELMREFRVR